MFLLKESIQTFDGKTKENLYYKSQNPDKFN